MPCSIKSFTAPAKARLGTLSLRTRPDGKRWWWRCDFSETDACSDSDLASIDGVGHVCMVGRSNRENNTYTRQMRWEMVAFISGHACLKTNLPLIVFGNLLC